MILLVRVDDRLVHGQVAAGWKMAINANHLVVIDDEVANNEFDRTLMEMSLPIGLTLDILTLEDAKATFESYEKDENKRVIILVKTPDIILELLKAGVHLKELNIGGMRFSSGKKQITKSVFLNEHDIAVIKEIASFGVFIEGRIVPTDKKGDFLKLL